jgi:hypothetical protein
MDFNCGTSITADCEALAYDWEVEATYKLLVNQIVDMGTLGVKLAVGLMASSLTDNLIKALNACRCMLLSFGNNTWTLLAAAYYAAK